MAAPGKIEANMQGAFVGALFAFLCSEAALRPSLWSADLTLKELLYRDALWGMAVGGFLGIGLGIIEGVVDRSWAKARRGLWLGAVLGMGAGTIGVPIAELFYRYEAAQGAAGVGPRALGWGIIGAAVGSVQGAVRNSLTTFWHGLLGGTLGGAVGGLVFEAVAASSDSDIIARLMGLLAIGLAEGFAVGLVQEMFKQAWLTAVSGRAEGRTYFLDKPVSAVGSHELCDIKLIGDPSVAPRQAEIRGKGDAYEVLDIAGNGQVMVNLRPVKSAVLGDGFLLQVGGQRFVMHIRGALAPVAQVSGGVAQPQQPVAALAPEEGICQFCGGRKDPVTGSCACMPGGTGIGGQWSALDNGPLPVIQGVSRDGPALVGLEGAVARERFPLKQAIVLIGRHSSNDIVLAADATVSRFHARLTRETEGMTIYDEGSSNGTFVNGERVYRRLLRSGDIITVGRATFRFEDSENGGVI